MGVAGIIIDSYCGSFPHSLLSTSKVMYSSTHSSDPFPICHGGPCYDLVVLDESTEYTKPWFLDFYCGMDDHKPYSMC